MKPGQRVNRKAPCPCGSGVKYKSCCFASDREAADGLQAAKRSFTPSAFRPAHFHWMNPLWDMWRWMKQQTRGVIVGRREGAA